VMRMATGFVLLLFLTHSLLLCLFPSLLCHSDVVSNLTRSSCSLPLSTSHASVKLRRTPTVDVPIENWLVNYLHVSRPAHVPEALSPAFERRVDRLLDSEVENGRERSGRGSDDIFEGLQGIWEASVGRWIRNATELNVRENLGDSPEGTVEQGLSVDSIQLVWSEAVQLEAAVDPE